MSKSRAAPHIEVRWEGEERFQPYVSGTRMKVPPVLLALGGRALPSPRPLRASIDPELAKALSRCLATDPAERPTAGQLAKLLAPVLEGAG